MKKTHLPSLKQCFFALIVRPFVWVFLGLHVRHASSLRLEEEGPLLIAANHNSHLDTLVLMALLPLSQINRVRPVAAADYFHKTRLRRWFSEHLIGLIAIDRKGGGGGSKAKRDPLAGCTDALNQGDILILFPEGSRGEPERMADLHSGVAHLAKRNPDVPVLPIWLRGCGKALPKGSALLVPQFCDVVIGEYLRAPEKKGGKATYMAWMKQLQKAYDELASELPRDGWEVGEHSCGNSADMV